jgi:hypothetical protein
MLIRSPRNACCCALVSRRRSWPLNSRFPLLIVASGPSSPMIVNDTVLLPEPDSPTSASVSPALIEKPTSRSALKRP